MVDISVSEGFGFVTHRRYTDVLTVHVEVVFDAAPPIPARTYKHTRTKVIDPRLPILGPIKPSLCRSCKVEQAYTTGFHGSKRGGFCTACCPCDDHRAERGAMRAKGLYLVR